MSHSDVILFYTNVIEDVISNVREDFISMGVDESVLFEFQLHWESKLVDSKVLVLPDSYPYSSRFPPLYQTETGDYSETKQMSQYYPNFQPFGFPGPQKPPGRFDGMPEDDTDDTLDSDLDDEDDCGEFLDVPNLVLCQYEKVARTKMRWKCNFKDGIMHLKGRDYVFQKGTTEFEF